MKGRPRDLTVPQLLFVLVLLGLVVWASQGCARAICDGEPYRVMYDSVYRCETGLWGPS